VIEAVQRQVTETVQDQGGQPDKLQEKVEQIVMEKIAEAVQKKAEEVTQPEQGTEEKKDVL
jgi:pimeloyl-CoA synthetase